MWAVEGAQRSWTTVKGGALTGLMVYFKDPSIKALYAKGRAKWWVKKHSVQMRETSPEGEHGPANAETGTETGTAAGRVLVFSVCSRKVRREKYRDICLFWNNIL